MSNQALRAVAAKWLEDRECVISRRGGLRSLVMVVDHDPDSAGEVRRIVGLVDPAAREVETAAPPSA